MSHEKDPMKALCDAMFDTHAKKDEPRYMWYGPLGSICIKNGELFVEANDGTYLPATKHQVDVWNEFANKVQGMLGDANE